MDRLGGAAFQRPHTHVRTSADRAAAAFKPEPERQTVPQQWDTTYPDPLPGLPEMRYGRAGGWGGGASAGRGGAGHGASWDPGKRVRRLGVGGARRVLAPEGAGVGARSGGGRGCGERGAVPGASEDRWGWSLVVGGALADPVSRPRGVPGSAPPNVVFGVWIHLDYLGVVRGRVDSFLLYVYISNNLA